MFYIKACPKCTGDLYVDQDQFGTFLECIQCGLVRDVKLNRKFDNVDRAAILPFNAPSPSAHEVLALTA
ncbi:MAG: hypothetical protein ACE5Q6_15515 [Dehalococcoidia bacterium]